MLPRLIQGGMGVGVSGWRLAHAVSAAGQLGVVSGTALDTILVRRLQGGDPGGHVRRAVEAFPLPEVGRRVMDRYFKPAQDAFGAQGATDAPGGDRRFSLLPLPRAKLGAERECLIMLANFVEVFLAKEGHAGVVGINYLEKIQFPMLPSLYGALLAGVDVVLVGAGIPAEIPGVLDRLTRHEHASLSLDVLDRGEEKFEHQFDPRPFGLAVRGINLRRPRFLPIVSSATLARALLKKSPLGIDGFVVEGPIAGGHNAPPRGQPVLSVRGEPVYGPRDEVDLDQMRALGVPFWLAGAYANPEKLAAARHAGAHGVQVGTVFAFCEESGLDPGLRRRFLAALVGGRADVFTDPAASPTGFPFKVAGLSGTLSESTEYQARPRRCDLGYLRRAYRKPDGTLGYRCPGEPVEDFVHKGGAAEDAVGRKCLCNALLANIGLGQHQEDGYEELPLLTAGDDLSCIRRFITPERLSYHASEVLESLSAVY